MDQLLPAAHAGDATGGAALHLASALEEAGYEAGLYALTVDSGMRDRVRPFADFAPPSADDTTLLHFALPSRLSRVLTECAGRRIVVYHNLTPPELLLPHSPEVARLAAIGRSELEELASSGTVDLAIGVSEFNTADLRRVGFRTTATLPLPMDMSGYDQSPDLLRAAELARGPAPFITVGRIAPNKRLEDFLRTAAYYLRYIEPNAHFLVVGGSRGMEGYLDALLALGERLGLDDRVRFLGRVEHRELIAVYRAAAAYLCTSVHEGFCAPLLEAMHFGVPILARNAAAVPETLGGAGITFDGAQSDVASSGDPASIAETLHALATDDQLRAHLQARGRQRVARFAPQQVASEWLEGLGLGRLGAGSGLGASAE